ncbi:MAG: alanyl-tRNA editing protein [Calditrichae bacterium]|nr:alanyl-tRNA editing protein [Calditrichia bacterium]
MTALLYQTDSYLKEFTSTVLEDTEQGVVLKETAFYPGGGGQPADTGILIDENGNEYNISGLKRIDGRIVHLIDGDKHPTSNSTVTGKIDWERRYKLMRTHTALHILCGVIWRDHSAQVTGGNMQPGLGRLDFEFEKMDKSLIGDIKEKINAEVQAARPVEIKILAREEAFQIPDLIRTKINLLPPTITEVRTVNIKGLDLQADGGTHVANTLEVGELKIVDYKSKGRINKRIVVRLAEEVNHLQTH